MNIIKRFGSYNASPRFAVNLLCDYCLCHNLKVGTFNRTGKPYQGSFDIWVRNRIAKLIDQTRDLFMDPNEVSGVSWVNGDDYQQSRETFGILPLPHASQITLGMLQYSDEYATGEKIRHANLAKQQQTHVQSSQSTHLPSELFSGC
ncbi:hypothetical protein APHAL10511_003943 [Amanita phalloides]|nr:hypothetical protein APHAL10511_003943 [Amanita phalloides]